MPAEDYNSKSSDSMFTAILAELKVINDRLADGTLRMTQQDVVLAAIKVQTEKTNGRVTKLEGKWKIVTAKIVGALLALGAVWQVVEWLYDHGIIGLLHTAH